MAITFFNPTYPEGLLDTMWDVQSCTPSMSNNRAASLNASGDESASQIYQEKITLSIKAKCNKLTDKLIIPSIGQIVETYHIDTITLAYSATDWPTLDISCHKHPNGSSHTSTHRKYSIPVAINDTLSSIGVGVPSGAGGLTLSDLTSGITSLSIALSANHIEAPACGTPPEIPASDNHDGTLTLTLGVIGKCKPTINSALSYDCTGISENESNTSNDDQSYTYITHITHDK